MPAGQLRDAARDHAGAGAHGRHLAVDTDAHAPGQLTWQPYGAARVAECGAPLDAVVTTWSAERVLEWTRSRR